MQLDCVFGSVVAEAAFKMVVSTRPSGRAALDTGRAGCAFTLRTITLSGSYDAFWQCRSHMLA